MSLIAVKYLEYVDPENPDQVRQVRPGEACDDLPESKAAQYLALGLVVRDGEQLEEDNAGAGGGTESEPDPTPAPDEAAGATDDEPEDVDDEESDDSGDDEEFEEVDLDEVLAGTVKDIAKAIAAGEHDEYLEELGGAEADGKARSGVADAIAARREVLEDGEE